MRKLTARLAENYSIAVSREFCTEFICLTLKEYGFTEFNDKKSRVQTISYKSIETGEKIIVSFLNQVSGEIWTAVSIKGTNKSEIVLLELKRFFEEKNYLVDGPKNFRPGRINLS